MNELLKFTSWYDKEASLKASWVGSISKNIFRNKLKLMTYPNEWMKSFAKGRHVQHVWSALLGYTKFLVVQASCFQKMKNIYLQN